MPTGASCVEAEFGNPTNRKIYDPPVSLVMVENVAAYVLQCLSSSDE